MEMLKYVRECVPVTERTESFHFHIPLYVYTHICYAQKKITLCKNNEIFVLFVFYVTQIGS